MKLNVKLNITPVNYVTRMTHVLNISTTEPYCHVTN